MRDISINYFDPLNMTDSSLFTTEFTFDDYAKTFYPDLESPTNRSALMSSYCTKVELIFQLNAIPRRHIKNIRFIFLEFTKVSLQ